MLRRVPRLSTRSERAGSMHDGGRPGAALKVIAVGRDRSCRGVRRQSKHGDCLLPQQPETERQRPYANAGAPPRLRSQRGLTGVARILASACTPRSQSSTAAFANLCVAVRCQPMDAAGRLVNFEAVPKPASRGHCPGSSRCCCWPTLLNSVAVKEQHRQCPASAGPASRFRARVRRSGGEGAIRGTLRHRGYGIYCRRGRRGCPRRWRLWRGSRSDRRARKLLSAGDLLDAGSVVARHSAPAELQARRVPAARRR